MIARAGAVLVLLLALLLIGVATWDSLNEPEPGQRSRYTCEYVDDFNTYRCDDRP